jgi:hypothetical protein
MLKKPLDELQKDDPLIFSLSISLPMIGGVPDY